jgi:uncharacterized RDD family membrane protein YckC
MNLHQIETSQNVGIGYQVASIGERLIATFLDYVVFCLYLLLITAFFGGMKHISPGAFVLMLLPVLLYNLICEIWLEGQSLGKKALGLRVVKTDGSVPGPGSFIIRWIFRILDSLLTIGSAATYAIISSDRGQRIGDIAAGTTVIRTKKKTSLLDTLYKELPENYSITFPWVKDLNEEDIQTIREVMHFHRKNLNKRSAYLVNKSKQQIEKRTNTTNKIRPYWFLNTILRDYNYLIQTKHQ